MKRNAFTLVESLVAALIVGVTTVSALFIINGYLKTTYARDVQTKAVIDNVSTIEKLKADVKTLNDLYEFSQNNSIRIIAVGGGEAELSKIGNKINMTLLSDESFAFSPQVSTNKYNLFRVIVGDGTPNTNLTAIIYTGGD